VSNWKKLLRGFEISNFEDDPTEQMWSDFGYGECCEAISRFGDRDWDELKVAYPNLNNSIKILLVQVVLDGPRNYALPIVLDCLASKNFRLSAEALDALNEKYDHDSNFYNEERFVNTVIKLILDKNSELVSSRYYGEVESAFVRYIRDHE